MFGHPSQAAHMMSGVKAALASPKTPPHLKPHLQKRIMTPTPLPRLTVPAPANNFPAEQSMGKVTTGKPVAAQVKKAVKKKYPSMFGGPR